MSYNAFSTGSPWKTDMKQKYESIKEELLNNEYITQKIYDNIMSKAKEYHKTTRARQQIYEYEGYKGILDIRETAYGRNHPFEYGDIMELHHLISIICYTDYSDLCTAWTATFRSIYFGETQESIQQRHASYHFLSKYLYQLIQYFGYFCHSQIDKETNIEVTFSDISGPFYCGMNRKMNFPSFSITLNSPTSTSRCKGVAQRFSGEKGVIITFNNNGLANIVKTAFFDASWLSRFKEEEEVYVYLFICLFFN